MTDLENILPLWHELESSKADYVLATVVAVEGPSYRKPGARMLIASDGRRAGTVSGGCLESEVAKRAWWLTESGPAVERYSTVADDGDSPYGSGCGGVVYILLERKATAEPLLKALASAFYARTPLAIATVLEGPSIGQRTFAGLPADNANSIDTADDALRRELRNLAEVAYEAKRSIDQRIQVDGTETRAWVDYRAARPGLWIFGAGDDAKPLVGLGRSLGWFVAVADGRSDLATRARFPQADVVNVLPASDSFVMAPRLDLRPSDAAVVMTHSYEQDLNILSQLLVDEAGMPIAYIGVLGPQRRTRDLLVEAARLRHIPDPEERVEKWLAQLHAPTGLDLGAETPATIALSILSEIQQTLAAASAQPLKKVRAVAPAVSC